MRRTGAQRSFRLFRNAFVFLTLFLAALLTARGCSTSTTSDRSAAVTALSDFDKLYLVRRPPLGDLYVIDVAGESFSRKLLAASMQGQVNRRAARIYLLDGEPSGVRPWETSGDRTAAEFWLKHYRETYGIREATRTSLDDALAAFAGELQGYVLAITDEPWTVNAATTIAARTGAVIATPAEVARLQALGLAQVDALAGRWSDAAACYRDLAATHAGQMGHPGLAVIDAGTYRLRDFLIQQGVLSVFSRPELPDWPVITAIFGDLPANVPVYGYMSLTGFEESVAVAQLSRAAKFLVPTDTTPNLSFHLAVKPPSQAATAPPVGTTGAGSGLAAPTACTEGGLLATIVMSDGDNLAIPISRYPQANYWNSTTAGTLPMGWSYSLALDALAPAIGEFYRATLRPGDERVAMLGLGYTLPTEYPDLDFLLGQSFRKMLALQLSTYWMLDLLLLDPREPDWIDIEARVLPDTPAGFLVGYAGTLSAGRERAFRTPGGRPVLAPANEYEDGPTAIAALIQNALALPENERPREIFISSSVWVNDRDGLVGALAPLNGHGVRFLKPRDALACVR